MVVSVEPSGLGSGVVGRRDGVRTTSAARLAAALLLAGCAVAGGSGGGDAGAALPGDACGAACDAVRADPMLPDDPGVPGPDVGADPGGADAAESLFEPAPENADDAGADDAGTGDLASEPEPDAAPEPEPDAAPEPPADVAPEPPADVAPGPDPGDAVVADLADVPDEPPPPVPVPDVGGLPLDEAATAIEAAGLDLGPVTEAPSCTVAPGSVADQDPPGGTAAPAGSPVALRVSSGPDRVVITEVMYHPDGEPPLGEFLELHNPCPFPLDLEGWRVEGIPGFVFGPGAFIEAGGYVVLAEDAAGFFANYWFEPDFVFGQTALSNAGERLRVVTAAGVVVDEVAYDDVPPWPVTPDGLGPSLEVVDPDEDNGSPRNWRASLDADRKATPRAVNSVDAAGLPPWVPEMAHGEPAAGKAIPVTARIDGATGATLTYVLDWGTEQAVPLADDGLAGDGAAGDGVFGAAIPGQPTGTLIRYRIDAAGPTGAMGRPRDDDTVRWTGTYVAPAVDSDLDVIHWIMAPQDWEDAHAHRDTDETEPALLFHAGVLHDGLAVRVRGKTSRTWPKKQWNFSFPKGHPFAAAPFGDLPVTGFNLQSGWSDKSYVRELLAWETFRDAGCPSLVAFPVTVWHNGQFLGLYTVLEDRDATSLERAGLDPDGSLYKSDDADGSLLPQESLPGPWEKTPEDGDYSELHGLLSGVNQSAGPARRDFLYGALDVPAMINYQAASVIVHNNDHVAKNFYLYRDRAGTGRWSMLAWDLDLTFGRMYQWEVLNDAIFADVDHVPDRPGVSPSHPLFGDSEHRKWTYEWNRVIDALLEDADIRRMYHRRLRTLMDEMLPPGRLEARIDQLAALLADEAAADRDAWGWYGAAETPAEAVARLKQEYLARRRTHLFQTHRVDGEIPPAQSGSLVVVINELMYNPYDDPADPAGAGDELEFVELYNPSATEAVDLSGWEVTGVELRVPPGAVLLPGAWLVVVRDDVRFRARYGPGPFVAAEYDGKLDGGGERVALVDRAGKVVDEVTYDDAPPWPVAPDGTGPSLELIDPGLDNALPSSWAPSPVAGGSPGRANGGSP